MDIQQERRLEPKRIAVNKKVDLVGADGAQLATGTANNMSDAGISVSFDNLPEMGPDVRLRVFWREGSAPIEQKAEVVWQNETYGEPAVAGFRLIDGTDEPSRQKIQPKKRRFFNFKSDAGNDIKEETVPAFPSLALGAPVWLQKGGVAIRAEVSSIGDIQEDNSVDLVLKVTDPAFCCALSGADADPLSPELQDFTAHPIRDAWQLTEKYLRPVIRCLSKALVKTAHLIAVGIDLAKAYLDARRNGGHSA